MSASALLAPRRWASSPAWAVAAAFGAYFCAYGFRKPFTAASFESLAFGGIGLKALLITSQTLGYALSKWIGIKIISEMRPERRVRALLGLAAAAELMLLGLALLPPPWNAAFLFFNGLALGMTFGLVLGFLEGRRNSEALIAGLCASFILADGMTKSAGAWLLHMGVSELAMPAWAGLLFLGPMIFFGWMLSRIPPPDERDMALRAARAPMDGPERRALFLRYAPGLMGLALVYLLLTLLRSVRADFAPEIWAGLGFDRAPALFTRSEFWVALGVVAVNGLSIWIRNNRSAFFVSLLLCALGFALVAWQASAGPGTDGFMLMVLMGLGMYIPYVAVHTTVFERFVAMTREKANIGYLMYFVDTIGYLGYCALMLAQSYLRSVASFLDFFLQLSAWAALAGLGAVLFSAAYFLLRRQASPSE
jgi:hypothetical protein